MWQTILGTILWILQIIVAIALIWLWFTNPERIHDRELKAKQEREARRLRAKELRS